MVYSDKTWASFAEIDRKVVPRMARRYAAGDGRLRHRLIDVGRRRLVECLVGVERNGVVDRYDEGQGVKLSTYAHTRLHTAMRDAATRTCDGSPFGPATVRLLYGEP